MIRMLWTHAPLTCLWQSNPWPLVEALRCGLKWILTRLHGAEWLVLSSVSP